MKIPDLRRLPESRPPSPYGTLRLERDGRWGSGTLPPGVTLYAVGWLGRWVPSWGKAPEACIDRLAEAYRQKLIFLDGTKGRHECEICIWRWLRDEIGTIVTWRGEKLRLYGHGHHLIQLHDIVYMTPALILHYLIDHHYRPPDAFAEAVRSGRFLTAHDLVFVEDPL